MPRGRRKVKNPATAGRILAAAEAHFAAEGMAGARTEEIATAARANKAMLYYYFGNKRRLHRAVLENLLRQLVKQVGRSGQSGNRLARDKLRAFVSGYFWIFLRPIRIIRAWFNAKRWKPAATSAGSCASIWCPFHDQLVGTLREVLPPGKFALWTLTTRR